MRLELAPSVLWQKINIKLHHQKDRKKMEERLIAKQGWRLESLNMFSQNVDPILNTTATQTY